LRAFFLCPRGFLASGLFGVAIRANYMREKEDCGI
jgi:hypothetical protein